MFLVEEIPISFFQRLCINIVKSGRIPKHVAFIMDGNRRFAKKKNVQKIDGHSKGYQKLGETLHWCKQLGITEVTVYAFSIDNFKRSKDEVDGLMDLAKEKFKEYIKNKDAIIESGVCIRIIGNISYLSDELKKLVAQVMAMTEKNNKVFINIAFSYSSRDEMTNSIKSIVDGVNTGLIDVNDIDEQLISECMYTNKSSDPDLLIRTSGELRLSDFLLWQISSTQICFTDVLWPEMSLWHLLAALLKYQTNYFRMVPVKEMKASIENQDRKENSGVAAFLQHVNASRKSQLDNYIDK